MVGVVSSLEQVFPDPITADEHQGSVQVNLTPGGTGGWRFAGERQWRAAGGIASGLANGYRVLEFRPVPGYIQPPGEPLLVMSSAATVVLTRAYTVNPGGGTGGLLIGSCFRTSMKVRRSMGRLLIGSTLKVGTPATLRFGAVRRARWRRKRWC